MVGLLKTAVTAFVMAGMLTTPMPDQQIQQEVEEPVPTYEYVGDYRVTAYAFYEGDGENYYTASGAEPIPYYTVATNDEFEFGTELYIEGVGIVQVQDRGAFPEGTIDLLIGDDPMSSFEDRTRAVYIVRGE